MCAPKKFISIYSKGIHDTTCSIASAILLYKGQIFSALCLSVTVFVARRSIYYYILLKWVDIQKFKNPLIHGSLYPRNNITIN